MTEETLAASETTDIRLTGRFMITGLAVGHSVFHWVMQSFVVVLPRFKPPSGSAPWASEGF